MKSTLCLLLALPALACAAAALPGEQLQKSPEEIRAHGSEEERFALLVNDALAGDKTCMEALCARVLANDLPPAEEAVARASRARAAEEPRARDARATAERRALLIGMIWERKNLAPADFSAKLEKVLADPHEEPAVRERLFQLFADQPNSAVLLAQVARKRPGLPGQLPLTADDFAALLRVNARDNPANNWKSEVADIAQEFAADTKQPSRARAAALELYGATVVADVCATGGLSTSGFAGRPALVDEPPVPHPRRSAPAEFERYLWNERENDPVRAAAAKALLSRTGDSALYKKLLRKYADFPVPVRIEIARGAVNAPALKHTAEIVARALADREQGPSRMALLAELRPPVDSGIVSAVETFACDDSADWLSRRAALEWLAHNAPDSKVCKRMLKLYSKQSAKARSAMAMAVVLAGGALNRADELVQRALFDPTLRRERLGLINNLKLSATPKLKATLTVLNSDEKEDATVRAAAARWLAKAKQ